MNTITTYRLFFSFLIAFAAFLPRPHAQAEQRCFQLFFPVLEAAPGDTVCIPLMARDFELVSSMQFGVQWDSSALSLLHVDISNAELPDLGLVNFSHLEPGKFRLSWNALSLMGISLPDSVRLFNLCFRVKPGATGFFPLQIGDLTDFLYFEVVQMLPPDWRTRVLPLTQQVGGISVGAGAAGTLAVTSSCAAGTVCNAFNGSASVEISGGQQPYTYHWEGPFSFSANTASVSGLGGGDYRVTVSDATGSTVAAAIRINNSPSTIWVTKALTAATCGQANGCATLTANGGTAPYAFSWPQDVSQTNESCALAPGQHVVTITDALNCMTTTQFTIGNASSFFVYANAQHIEECGGTGTVFASPNVPNYHYLWSTGDTTQTVSGLLAGIYTVTVSNQAGCTAEDRTEIVNVYTYYWDLFLNTSCNPSTPEVGKMALIYKVNGTLGFPCTVAWSNGTVHTIQEKPSGIVLDSLLNVPFGKYSATVWDVAGCSSTIEQWLDCTTMPPVPEHLPAFYIHDEYLNPQYALDSCIGVFARNFENIQSLSFSLQWNVAEVSNLRHLNLPGLSYADFTFEPASHALGINWQSPDPVTLPAESLLFEVCFAPQSEADVESVTFSDTPVDVQLINAQNEELAFIGMDGYVMYDLYFPLQPSLCKFGVVPPDCSTDGKSSIVLGQCNPGLEFDATINAIDGNVYYGGISALLSVPEGKYEGSVLQTASAFNYFFAKIPPGIPSDECVWPGDADNNNAVNHYDLLYLGLGYDAAGPSRPNATENWLGQSAADWSEETPLRKVNFKNIDANGDGLINAADTSAIVANWTRVINPTFDGPFDAPKSGNATGVQALSISADTLFAGQSAVLPLLLGSQNEPLDSVYGLAFSVSYDPSVIKDNIRFMPGSSWFADADQYLILQKNFPEQHHLDVAITRIDGVPVSGWGAIGNFFIIIEDNIFGEPDPVFPGDTSLKTLLYFTGMQSVNARGNTKGLENKQVELVIQQLASATQELPWWDRQLRLYPNPATDVLQIQSPETPVIAVEISDLAGRKVYASVQNASVFDLSVRQLPAGAYFVQVFTEKGKVVRKLNIIR